MAAVTIHSDFGAQENSLSLFPLFPHLFSVKWWEHIQWDWLVYGVQAYEFSHAHGWHHHRDASPPNLPSSSHHTFPPHPWPRPTPALLTLLVVVFWSLSCVCEIVQYAGFLECLLSPSAMPWRCLWVVKCIKICSFLPLHSIASHGHTTVYHLTQ